MAFSNLVKDENHCRLASEDLVEKCNRLSKSFDQATERPALGRSAELDALLERLEEIRKHLQRPCYSIGFIGPSQVGKSTSFNNVLDINKATLSAEEYDARVPAKEGIGDAMTASITRLHAGDDNKCVVEYLTHEMHEFRCKIMGYPEINQSNIEEHIENLEQQISDRNAAEDKEMAALGQDTAAGSGERTLKGLDKTHRYFKSYQNHSEVLNTRREIPYSQRGDVINHSPGKPPSEQWLQQFVELEFETDKIAQELEMVDLPGLAANPWDDMVTKGFLPDLDAALYFLNCGGNINDTAFNHFIDQMQEQFGRDLTGRLWVVAFRGPVETPTEIQVQGNNEGESFFDTLSMSIGDKNIPLDQLIFISNLWFQRHLAGEWDPSDHYGVAPCNFQFDQTGGWTLSESWERHPELAAAFKKFMPSGGIDSLRELMQQTIKQKVEERSVRDCKRNLKDLVNDLRVLVRLMKDKAGMSAQEMLDAAAMATEMGILSEKLRWDRKFYAEPSIAVIEKLKADFDRVFPENYTGGDHALHENYNLFLNTLTKLAEEEIRVRMLPSLYELSREYIAVNIPKDGKDILVPIRVKNGASAIERSDCLNAWDKFQKYDTMQVDIATSLLQDFRRSRLFSEDNQFQTFNSISDFRDFMHRRLEVLVHNICFKATSQMNKRLMELSRALRLLGQEDGAEEVTATEVEKYDELLEDLEQLYEDLM